MNGMMQGLRRFSSSSGNSASSLISRLRRLGVAEERKLKGRSGLLGDHGSSPTTHAELRGSAVQTV